MTGENMMGLKRKQEFFESYQIKNKSSLGQVPPMLFRQERDWTCCFACIRSLLSGIEEGVDLEDNIINGYNIVPGPYYSKDIKSLGLLDKYDVQYGCDYEEATMDTLFELIKNNYYIMIECMINYAHWLVLLGYYSVNGSDNYESHKLLFYDPYYDTVRLENFDEFTAMWIDGNYSNTKVKNDFIAIKGRE